MFEKESYQEAIESFSSAIKESGESVSAHFNNRGLAYFHMHQNEEALHDFDRAVAINSKDPNIFYNRANVYLNMNHFERAREEFDTAIRLQPSNPKFFHAKGLAFEAEAIH